MDRTALVIILLVMPFVMLMLHMLLSRLLSGRPPQAVAVKAAAAGYVPLALLVWFGAGLCRVAYPENLLTLLYAVVVYSSCGYAYFHFFNMSETARRIRILAEINRAGSLPLSSILALYTTSGIVSARLRRLVALGKLSASGDGYRVSGRLLYWAAIGIRLWRSVIGFEKK